MSYILKMPAAGEGIMEAEIVKWTKNVGDNVEVDETIAEVQNDKMVQEIPSPVSGKILKILVPEGEVAQVGEALAEIDAEGVVSEEVEVVEEVKVDDKAEEVSTTALYAVTLPPAGEGIVEAEISEILVSVGDAISVDQSIAMVQNDKMVQEVPSPINGKVVNIVASAGDVLNVGDTILEVEFDGPAKTVVKDNSEEKIVESAKAVSSRAGSSIVAGRVLAMPSVRQYARDLNIDITQVSGTGKHNHITKADIDNFVAAPVVVEESVVVESAPVAPQALPQVVQEAYTVSANERTTREKMTPIRRAISKAMVNSKTRAPHVTLFDEVEVSKLMDHRRKYKDVAAQSDIKLTYLAYMAKAVTSVIKKYPILNSSVDESSDEIVYKNYFNMGIAVDTEAGLFVPVIKDIDQKGIFKIADEISSLATKASDGKLSMAEMSDGSTTISNIGSAWGGWFTPIINHPEVAIFGMGRIEKKPVVLEDNTIGVGQVLLLSLSFDHRVIDGLTAQLAMNELKRLIADPELLLMEG